MITKRILNYSTGSLQKMNLESVITPSTIGVALVVTNDYTTNPTKQDLKVTYTDGKKMKAFLVKCKYKVFWYHNLTQQQFVKLYKEMAKYEYPKTCRRLLVYFSGHGSNGERLLTEDGKYVSVHDMVTSFKPVNAKNITLRNTVRMFFIDACRGNKSDYGYSSNKSVTATITHNTKSDKDSSNDTNILLAYSTTSEHVSGVSAEEMKKGTGSFWTECLLKELENSHDDILIILRNVNKVLEHKKTSGGYYQMGETNYTLVEGLNFKKEAGLDQKFQNGKKS